MAYERINWQNEPSEATAVNNVNLNKMDSAIYDHDQRLDTDESNITDLQSDVGDVQGDITDLQNGKVDKVDNYGLSLYKSFGYYQLPEGQRGTLIGYVGGVKQNGQFESVGDVYNGVVVDNAMSSSSENPVQNKVVKSALDNKVDKVVGKGLSQVDNVTVTQHVAYGTVVSTIKTYKQDGTEVTSQVCNGIVVDSALSDSSTNPVQNKVVKSAIDEKSTVAISDTLATGTTLANITIDGTTTAIKGSDIEVDEELSPTSTNPVENKAIYDALNNLLPSKTVSGNPIAIDDASGLNAKALTVSMNPIQDLHGYDHPWAGGAGKNKFNDTIGTHTINANTDVTLLIGSVDLVADTTYTISCKQTPNTVTWVRNLLAIRKQGTTSIIYNSLGSADTIRPMTYTPSETATFDILVCGHTLSADTTYSDFQVEVGTQVTDFAPYENICPISGRTEASVTRTAGEDAETHTKEFGQTVYGGTLDVTEGVLTVDMAMVSLKDLPSNRWNKLSSGTGAVYMTRDIALPGIKFPITEHPISSDYNYQISGTMQNGSFRASDALYIVDDRFSTITEWIQYLATSDAVICYELATPTTIQLSPEAVTLLKGQNVISTDGDDMELKYSVSLDSLLS